MSIEAQQHADLLAAPTIDDSLPKTQHFEALFHAALRQGVGSVILSTDPYPVYEFLCYLVEHNNALTDLMAVV
jgi:hypothetical protein